MVDLPEHERDRNERQVEDTLSECVLSKVSNGGRETKDCSRHERTQVKLSESDACQLGPLGFGKTEGKRLTRSIV